MGGGAVDRRPGQGGDREHGRGFKIVEWNIDWAYSHPSFSITSVRPLRSARVQTHRPADPDPGTGGLLPAWAVMDSRTNPYGMIKDVDALEGLYDNFSGLIELAKNQLATRDVEGFEYCQRQIRAQIEAIKRAQTNE